MAKFLYTAMVLSISLLARTAYAASCTTYSSEETCSNDNLCVWFFADGGYCACASTVAQEVMFIMDSSTSVGPSGWETQQAFVTSMITSGVDQNSYVAVMNFASGAWVQWTFTDSQSRSQIISHVNSIAYTGGFTWMRDALEGAIAVFERTGDPNIDNLAMLITDGNPIPSDVQSVCSSSDDVKRALDDAGIKVVVIGVGDQWSTTSIDCLVDDPDTQIIFVDDFTDDDFDAVRIFTDKFLCPTADPTPTPTDDPTPSPTENPTLSPTDPTGTPTEDPTPAPTGDPTLLPTDNPTLAPIVGWVGRKERRKKRRKQRSKQGRKKTRRNHKNNN